MQTEFEAKALEIDKEALREKLRALGATLVFAEKSFERFNFDTPELRLQQTGGWIRLREGEPDGSWTMAYKEYQPGNATIDGMKEIEFGVSSAQEAKEFLIQVGFQVKSHQQRTREQWKLDDVEIDIDTWPWIPAFAEVEGADEASVRACFEKLGLDYSKAVFGAATEVYRKYGFPQINHVKELAFDAKPER